jgi:hypothetical protein
MDVNGNGRSLGISQTRSDVECVGVFGARQQRRVAPNQNSVRPALSPVLRLRALPVVAMPPIPKHPNPAPLTNTPRPPLPLDHFNAYIRDCAYWLLAVALKGRFD